MLGEPKIAIFDDVVVSVFSTLPITKFRIVLLPDTQKYLQNNNNPDIFTKQTQWIANNHLDQNIKFVMHEGDIVHNNNHAEWQLADTSMSLLDGVVPYSLLPGNHDMGPNGSAQVRDTTLYNQYFPVARYQNTPTFGGVYPGEPDKYDNNYHIFSAGGTDWLVLSLEFGPRDPVIDWANDVVINHPNHRVIVVTHSYMYHDDSRHSSQWTSPNSYGVASGPGGVNDGEEMWNEFVKLHSNISFVFNGHVLGDGLGRMESVGDFGNSVYQIVTNYQSYNNGGDGYLRILEIDPSGNTFTAKSYSPHLNQYKTDNQNQYTYNNVDLKPPNGGSGPVMSISDVSVTEGGSAVFSIMLSSAASNNVVIDYQTVNGTAISGSDYNSRSGRIVFSPGDTVKTRTVNILQDNLTEANEIFTMTLTNPVNATLGQSTGTATITGDNGGGGPVMSISDVSVTEGGSAVFSIMLSSAASNNVVIDYQTVNGTAISGSDYNSRSGRIVFSPGDTVKTRTVNILQDNLTEANEIFTMTLTNPVNATLGQSTGIATITGDNGGGGPVMSISDVSVTEGGSAVFSIMLSSAASNNVVIDYQTVNGTAISGSDYNSRSGRIVFSPGDTVKTRTVNILQDNLTEANEIFTMTLTNPVNATLGQSTGTATITDMGD